MAEDTAKPEDKEKTKPRRILERDLDLISTKLKDRLALRKKSPFRMNAERKWKEVDRQIQMQEMVRVARDASEQSAADWHNAVELGELSMSSEIFSADIQRITFPMNRTWFDPHSDITEKMPLDPQSGERGQVPNKMQKAVDGALRAMMAQQHIDFGLKSRFGLSVKETLHHGGFVATVEEETMEAFFEDASTSLKRAPVWKVHSMWNCWPDPNPSAIAENMYYQGSMYIRTWMPYHEVKKLSGEGFWQGQIKKVTKRENRTKDEEMTEEAEIITFYGEVVIERKDGNDIFLPNMKCQIANDVLIYARENATPYPPIIYRGWERMDVRDPYFTSPIIKQSPFQKLGSLLANKFIDATELRTEPPLVYDANDPDFVISGGPAMFPGAKIPARSSAAVKPIEVGDPSITLEALKLCLTHMQEGLSISPSKVGQPLGDRATARQVASVDQGSEIRVLHFIEQANEALRVFLYMQHSLNLRRKDFSYEFYNPEMEAPDFMRVVSKDLPRNAVFDVVGARGVLGETERAAKMTAVVLLAEKVPAFAGQLNHTDILLQMFEDAGVKNPERFLNISQDQIPPQVKQMMQQMQQALQQMGQELKDAKTGNEVKLIKSTRDYHAKMTKIMTDAKLKGAKIVADHVGSHLDRQTDLFKHMNDPSAQMQGYGAPETSEPPQDQPNRISMRKVNGGYEARSKSRTIKIRKTADGFEGESHPTDDSTSIVH